MSYLVDTNIISEVRKGDRCDPNVAAWFASVPDRELYLSALVIGEIRKGIERARAKMPARAKALEDWLKTVTTSFAERILPIDRAAAEEWGRMSAKRPVSTVDALLAATAKVNGLTFVTRNTADVADLGAKLLNPFEPRR
jgi:predicted nucleic acid-binding protein